MRDPAADYMREAFLGLADGGVAVDDLSDDEWRMFRSDMNRAIRQAARSWTMALAVLREQPEPERTGARVVAGRDVIRRDVEVRTDDERQPFRLAPFRAAEQPPNSG